MSQEQSASSQQNEHLVATRLTDLVQHEEPVSQVEEAVVHLLNVAVVLVRDDAGKAELECKMCGLRDENHTITCVVPALEEWINPTEL